MGFWPKLGLGLVLSPHEPVTLGSDRTLIKLGNDAHSMTVRMIAAGSADTKGKVIDPTCAEAEHALVPLAPGDCASRDVAWRPWSFRPIVTLAHARAVGSNSNHR